MVARKSRKGTVRAKVPKAMPSMPAPTAGARAKPATKLALPIILFLIGILIIVPILSLARVIGGITPLVLLAGALVGLILVAYFSMRTVCRGVLTE